MNAEPSVLTVRLDCTRNTPRAPRGNGGIHPSQLGALWSEEPAGELDDFDVLVVLGEVRLATFHVRGDLTTQRPQIRRLTRSSKDRDPIGSSRIRRSNKCHDQTAG